MTDFEALTAANLKRFKNAKLTRDASGPASRLVSSKLRYLAVSVKTGVPWFVIAVIHERESSQNWMCSLAQGDRWDRESVHVPVGRGPFKSWEEAAVDALLNCAPYLGKRKDWSLAGILVGLEMYNGTGYANKGEPSPYLWAGTDQYRSGKYVRDGVYDPTAVDRQLGCVALFLAMMTMDPGIKMGGEQVTIVTPPAATGKPAPGSVGAWFKSFFARKP